MSIEIIKLTSDERKELREAIISAYPSKGNLEIMISDGLGENLNKITPETNLTEVVFYLIQWAEAQGQLKHLIDAACQGKPDNQYLKDVKNIFFSKTIKQLQAILAEFKTKSESLIIKEAYKYCVPDDWIVHREISDNLEKIINQILIIPQGKSSYTKLEHFVAYLITKIADYEIDRSVILKLKEWAEINIKELSALLNQINIYLTTQLQNQKYYLLVVINRSGQDSTLNQNSDFYRVDAWLFYEIQDGYEKVYLSGDDNITFKINDIPKRIQFFLDKSTYYRPNNLTIEIFIPFDIINYPVDSWQLEDNLNNVSLVSTIGQDYEVLIRSYERLVPNYKRRLMFWENKWKQLEKFKHNSVLNSFHISNDSNVQTVITQLRASNTIGLLVTTALKKEEREKVFIAILKNAIPVALWLRKDLNNVNCVSEIQKILNCKIEELPNIIKDKRSQAQNPDTDIGYHLSLLWEDPNRLPPTN